MIRIPAYWSENWGRVDWFRRLLIRVDLLLHGGDTYCGSCGRFSSAQFCDCEEDRLREYAGYSKDEWL